MPANNNFKVETTLILKPEVNTADLKSAVGQINSLIDRMGVRGGAYRTTQGNLAIQLGSGVSPQQRGAITKLSNELLGLKNAQDKVNESQDNFYGKSKRNIGTILLWAAGWQVAYGAINTVKQAISTTLKDFGDLEMAFIRIKQASGESGASFSKFSDSAFKVARITGTSVTDIAQASKIWAQQGKSIAESLKLTETATIAVNLTGQTTQETISELTGVMNAWGFTAEQTSFALDKFAKVADKEAVEVKDLMEGFLNVGLTAKTAGVSFEELTGLLTAVVTVTRKAGREVGDAFRTMFTRFMRADTLSTIQTLSKVAVYVDEFGNATYANTGRIRNFTAVYQDLVKVMPQLAETTQAKILEQLTGARRSEIGRAMFAGEGIVNRTMIEQANAFGYSAQKNTEIMDSWNKKVAVLGISFQQLGQSIAQSGLMDALKNIVDSLTSFLDILSESKESLYAFYRIFIVIAGTALFTKLIFNLDAVAISFKTATVAATNFKFALGIIGLAGGFALMALIDAIHKTNEALDKEAEAIKDLYQVPDAMKNKLASMTQEQRDARRVNLLAKMREELKKGNLEVAYRLANEIKATDITSKGAKTIAEAKKNGLKVEEDAELTQKKQTENLRHQLAIQQTLGTNTIALKQYELEQWEKINDTQLDSVEHLKLQNELIEEYVKEVYSLASTYQTIVSDGLDKMITGTGTLNDMTKDLVDTMRKTLISDLVDIVGEQTGVFNFMSALTKNPIAQAHINGLTTGSKLIVQAHIAGIQAGMSGQTSAQAMANIQGGGGSLASNTNKKSFMSSLFGGADWTQNVNQNIPSGAYSTYTPGQTGPNAGTYGAGMNKKTQFWGSAAAGALTGYQAYQSAVSGGANQWAAAGGGILSGIGMMGLMSGNPVTMLGGAVLMGIGSLVSSMGGNKKTTTEVKEQTNQVTSRLNVTNKQLEIVNRNLVSLRKGFEGFVMQESFYLRSRSRNGVNAQVTSEFALNSRRGYQ
jgi:TP901 family phage tail tape measure protein